jgi:hypothetical protein
LGLTTLLVLFWGFVFAVVFYVYPPKFLKKRASKPWVEPSWARWMSRHAGVLSGVAITAIMGAAFAQLSWFEDSFWPLGLLYGGLMAGGLYEGAKRLLR